MIEHSPAFYVSELIAANWAGISTMIITCLDPRCVPETFFDLKVGEVFVHRNMGGSARAALRDIVTLDTLFSTSLEEICIIHHTDCGTTHVSKAAVRAHVKSTTDKNDKDVYDMDIFTIGGSIEESVQTDMEWVQNSPFLREELRKNVQGFVYDIKTGLVTRVEPKVVLRRADRTRTC